jgi:hypothetical protein
VFFSLFKVCNFRSKAEELNLTMCMRTTRELNLDSELEATTEAGSAIPPARVPAGRHRAALLFWTVMSERNKAIFQGLCDIAQNIRFY